MTTAYSDEQNEVLTHHENLGALRVHPSGRAFPENGKPGREFEAAVGLGGR